MGLKRKAYNVPWPPPWRYNKAHRLLGWAAKGHCLFEDGTDVRYKTKQELEDCLHEHNGYILMPDYEFFRWVKPFVRAGDACMYADAAQRIVGFKSKRGRRVRYIYRAGSAWPGMDELGAGGLARLRRFLDEWQLGDCSTPGTLGLRLAEVLTPKDEVFWRPPWNAWADLHTHGVAGWVDLFMRYQGEEAVMVDMNSAYPSAAMQGMPAGRCWQAQTEEDLADGEWYFGIFKWRLSSDPGVVQSQRFTILAITNRDNPEHTGSGTVEPGASGRGWYTRVEVEAARNSGAFDSFELVGAWLWERVSTAFAVWTERVDAAKARYKALGENAEVELGWVKRMSVAPFGRFFCHAKQTRVYEPGTVDADGETSVQAYGRHLVPVQLVRQYPTRPNPTLLPQLAVHVWTTTRMNLAQTMQMAADAGWTIRMCAIDGIYATRARGSPTVLSGLMYGLSPGQWKQRELFDVNVSAAGTVSGRLESGEKFVRMPGIPKNSPLRSADNVIR